MMLVMRHIEAPRFSFRIALWIMLCRTWRILGFDWGRRIIDINLKRLHLAGSRGRLSKQVLQHIDLVIGPAELDYDPSCWPILRSSIELPNQCLSAYEVCCPESLQPSVRKAEVCFSSRLRYTECRKLCWCSSGPRTVALLQIEGLGLGCRQLSWSRRKRGESVRWCLRCYFRHSSSAGA